jgi:hypothetical protein
MHIRTAARRAAEAIRTALLRRVTVSTGTSTQRSRESRDTSTRRFVSASAKAVFKVEESSTEADVPSARSTLRMRSFARKGHRLLPGAAMTCEFGKTQHDSSFTVPAPPVVLAAAPIINATGRIAMRAISARCDFDWLGEIAAS